MTETVTDSYRQTSRERERERAGNFVSRLFVEIDTDKGTPKPLSGSLADCDSSDEDVSLVARVYLVPPLHRMRE